MALPELIVGVEDRIMKVYVDSGNECDALDRAYAWALRQSSARMAMDAIWYASVNLGLSIA